MLSLYLETEELIGQKFQEAMFTSFCFNFIVWDNKSYYLI